MHLPESLWFLLLAGCYSGNEDALIVKLINLAFAVHSVVFQRIFHLYERHQVTTAHVSHSVWLA